MIHDLSGVANQFSKKDSSNACITISVLTLYQFYVRSRKVDHSKEFDLMNNGEWATLFERAIGLYEAWREDNPMIAEKTMLPTLDQVLEIDVCKANFLPLFQSSPIVIAGMAVEPHPDVPKNDNIDYGGTLYDLFVRIRRESVKNAPYPVCTILTLPCAITVSIFSRKLVTRPKEASFLLFDSHGKAGSPDCTLHEFHSAREIAEHLIKKHDIWRFEPITDTEIAKVTTQMDIDSQYGYDATLFLGK